MKNKKIEHSLSIDYIDDAYKNWLFRESDKIINDFNIRNIKISFTYFQPEIFSIINKFKSFGYKIWFDIKIYEIYEKLERILLYLKQYSYIDYFTILCIENNIDYVKELVYLCNQLNITPILTSYYCRNYKHEEQIKNIIEYISENIIIKNLYVPFNLATYFNLKFENVCFFIHPLHENH